jgi:DNA-binding LytR/AlgR family response regulator
MIIDDEPNAIERLKRMLEQMKFAHISTLTDPVEAIEICKYKKFDLIFLDIEMPQMNGMIAAEEIKKILPNIGIVFTTAYSDFALNAFKIGALDYLLKPFDKEDLQLAINKAVNQIAVFNQDSNDNSTELIAGKMGNKVVFFDVKYVFYIEASLNETIFRTNEEEYYVSKKFSDFFYLLKSKFFIKIHRSCIVNLLKIDYIEPFEAGKYCIHFKGIKNVVYTSKSGSSELRESFKSFIL